MNQGDQKLFQSRRDLSSQVTPIFSLSLIIFVWSFAFDFRGTVGGTWVQYAMAVAAVISFLVFSSSLALRVERSFAGPLFSAVAFVCLASFVAISQRVPFDRILRIGFPYALMCMGIFVGAHVAIRALALPLLSRSIVWAALASSVFRYFYATRIDEIGLNEMRYQLLTPALPALYGHLVALWVSGRRFSLFDFAVTALTLLASILSLTRSLLVVALSCGIIAVAAIWTVSFRNRIHEHLGKYRRRVFIWAAGATFVGCVAAVQMRRDAVDAWISRFVDSGSRASGTDLTTITRLAEITGIWRQVSSTTSELVLGNGFGATYYWDSEYLADWLSISGSTAVEFQGIWQPTHSIFTSALLYLGIIGAFFFLWLVWWTCLRGWNLLRTLRVTSDHEILYQGTFYSAMILLYFVQGISGSPLGERMAGVLMGVAIGVMASFNMQAWARKDHESPTPNTIRGRIISRGSKRTFAS